MLIFCDTETTGLVRPIGSPLHKQPHITEIFMALTDYDLKIIDAIDTLIKPPVAIPEYITRITKIDDDMVKNAPSFKKIHKHIKSFFKQADALIMHNWCFDWAILENEATRNKKKLKAPPAFCTVEQSMHLMGRRLRLQELYHLATGETDYGAHRAENDVRATMKCFSYIVGGNHELVKHKD